MNSELDLRFMKWWNTVGKFRFGRDIPPQREMLNREIAYAGYLEGSEAERERSLERRL